MMGDDSMSDDVFEVDDDKSAINYNLASTSSMSYLPPASPQPYVLQHQHGNYHSLASERLAQAVLPTPSPTGYRDYTPPAEVFEQSNFAKSRMTDNIWSSYKRDDNPENAVHKVRRCFYPPLFMSFVLCKALFVIVFRGVVKIIKLYNSRYKLVGIRKIYWSKHLIQSK